MHCIHPALPVLLDPANLSRQLVGTCRVCAFASLCCTPSLKALTSHPLHKVVMPIGMSDTYQHLNLPPALSAET